MESPVVSVAEMRAAEASAFARGISPEALMEAAGAGIARAVEKFFPRRGHCVVFAGKGHNAGDAFVAARHLQHRGWTAEVRLAFPQESFADRALENFLRLEPAADPNRGPVIVLDGLLGIGAALPLRDPIRSACREINRLRREENAFVVALDLPTGLDADSGAADPDTVIADLTATIGFAKRGLLADEALNYVGRLEVISLQELTDTPVATAVVATNSTLRALLPRRKFGAYKNQFGRVGVIAGSEGLTGAAVLCASGALRGGAGLVELFIPREIYPIVAASAPPEVMVKPVDSYRELLDAHCDVWAIGPGLGRARAEEILALVRQLPSPAVIDADALNILSHSPHALDDCAGPRLFTPHPGEMKRLFPGMPQTRAEIARAFCAKHPVTLLLKGSRTIVHGRDRTLSYNPTGTPAMATGGMGDVLTGVCAALIGQGLALYDAARLGAWVCGRAAELAVAAGEVGEESLLPSDLLEFLGRAFDDLRAG